MSVTLALLLAMLFAHGPAGARTAQAPSRPPPRVSVAVGSPSDGSLRHGVLLPATVPHLRTWDPILDRSPNRAWRRHGTDRLVAMLRRVARDHARAHPAAAPLLVGDLSRPRGGDFGPRYGIVGHASHQNGRDADVYHPRADGRAAPPRSPGEVDRRLARSLVRRFLDAGAELVYVSPDLGVRAAGAQPIAGHETHLHVRIGD